MPHSYYHVFTRGINKQKIFLEAADYHYFISLFERYLSGKPATSKTGDPYPNYHHEVRLLSYCLMKNHIHLLVYQSEDCYSLKKFMGSLMTSYSKYFNLKYGRRGALFESRYKAKRIDNDSYLVHIARYVHMNPRRWQNYNYSSLRYIFNKKTPEWLAVNEVTSGFKNRRDYLGFLGEYEANKFALEEIKNQLSQI